MNFPLYTPYIKGFFIDIEVQDLYYYNIDDLTYLDKKGKRERERYSRRNLFD